MKYCAVCKKHLDGYDRCPTCGDTNLSHFCPGDRVHTLDPDRLCRPYHNIQGVVDSVEPKMKNQRLAANDFSPTQVRVPGNLVFVKFCGPVFEERCAESTTMTNGLRLEEDWIIQDD